MNSSQSPATEILEAASATIASPTPAVLMEDLLLAHKLAGEMKALFATKPQDVRNIFLWLFNS